MTEFIRPIKQSIFPSSQNWTKYLAGRSVVVVSWGSSVLITRNSGISDIRPTRFLGCAEGNNNSNTIQFTIRCLPSLTSPCFQDPNRNKLIWATRQSLGTLNILRWSFRPTIAHPIVGPMKRGRGCLFYWHYSEVNRLKQHTIQMPRDESSGGAGWNIPLCQ